MTNIKQHASDQDEAEDAELLDPAISTVSITAAPGLAATPLLTKYEIDPRTGGAVLVSVMEMRRARARELNTPKQSARRARIKAERDVELASTLAALDHLKATKPPAADRQTLVAEARAFRKWLKIDGRHQWQCRSQQRSYMVSRMVLLNARLEFDDDPSPAEFAARLTVALGTPFNRMKARNRLLQLLKLEGPEGPWFPGPAFD